MKRLLYAVALLGLGGPAWAGGYQVSLQGQKQIGMAHTGTGLALDPAALFFNPGAMSHLRENGFTVGGSAIFGATAFVADGSNRTYRTDNPVGTPFAAYAVWGPTPETVSQVKFGIGVYTPYGSSVQWEDEWAGRYALQQLSLRAISVQPTVSYNIVDRVGIGAGFVYTFGGVNLQRDLPIASQNGDPATVELDGSARGFGFNIGLFVQPVDAVSVGLSYRSRIDMRVDEGSADFRVPGAARASFPADNTFDAELPLPAVASVGLGIQVTERLLLAVDANLTFWSAYDSLTFTYTEALTVEGLPTSRTSSPRAYEDALALRLGAQFKATEALALRAGAYYDQTPVQDGYLTPETPDADRLGVSLGVGYRIGGVEIDASLLFITGAEREQTDADIDAAGTAGDVLAGRYQLGAVIPGVSASYRF
ncbi:MAG: outer membrane protein transport protein [Catalinimonas sp.]